MDEALLMRMALGGYGAACVLWWRQHVRSWGLWALSAALALHGVALVLRWRQHGHGPFTTMHEILSSNLWSLALVACVAAWLVRDVRAVLVHAMPVWMLLAAWLLVADPSAGHFPATYDTMLLYLHTVLGKLYLGLLLVAVALGLAPWWPRPRRAQPTAAIHAVRLDELAHRFSAFAFVFQTLMLAAGAVWAQDAWGRYWDWDPLESWAFASWALLGTVLHARGSVKPSPATHGLWLLCAFVLAFLTFFGVPFLSVSPHKGAI